MRGHNLNEAYACAKACELVYLTKDELEKGMLDECNIKFANIKWIDQSVNQVFMGTTDQFIFVVFRGTESEADLEANKTFVLMPWAGSGRTHHGFTTGVMETLPEIKKYIGTFGCNKQLVITGHSMGGAMASMTAMLLYQQEEPQRSTVYTFGQPRTGDATFAEDYSGMRSTWRFVNDNDPVARLPFRNYGYRHFDGLKYLTADGEVKDKMTWWQSFKFYLTFAQFGKNWFPKVWPQHYMPQYLAKLKKFYKA